MVILPFRNSSFSVCLLQETGGTRMLRMPITATPSYSEGSSLAGSKVPLVALALVAVLKMTSASAAPEPPADTGVRTGEIVIGLPEGADHDVSFTFGDGKVSLA